MNNWQIDLFTGLHNATAMQDVIDVAYTYVRPMGFDHCGWRARAPLPMTRPRSVNIYKNEDNVFKKEAEGGYDEENAPILKHCSSSMAPLQWQGTTDEPLFHQAPALFEEFYSWGHRAGWAQSLIESKQFYSMFWVNSSDVWAQKDLNSVDFSLQWIATAVLSRINQVREKTQITLSYREQEVLRWTGDGKTADQIAEILMLSPSTINFHLRNAMMKLDAPNKTAAVVRAIFLGLLH